MYLSHDSLMENLGITLIINILFWSASLAFLAINVRRIFIDKTATGESILTPSLFIVWILWDLLYYAVLEPNLSDRANGAIELANLALVLIIMALYFKKKGNK